MIRYKTGDIVIPNYGRCSCGRNSPLIRSVSGRVSEILKLKNGDKISGSTIIHFFRQVDNVEKYQLVQSDNGFVEVKVIRRKDFTDSDSDMISEFFSHNFGDELNFTINYVNNIPLSKSGKLQFIIKNSS